jgi:hypothetical protein
MKKETVNKTSLRKNGRSITLFYLFIGGVAIIAMGCKKPSTAPVSVPQLLNNQEQMLTGKWNLKRAETYEVSGIDSTGQYICDLIGSSTCSSSCKIEFKNEYFGAMYKGVGSMGGCDSTTSFGWKVKQPNKLETSFGNFYDIIYMTKDSAAFSTIYIKGILTLKTIIYYRR